MRNSWKLIGTIPLLLMAGCSGEKPPANPPPMSPSSAAAKETPSATPQTQSVDDPQVKEQLQQASAAIDQKNLSEAQPLIEQLRERTSLSDDEQAQLGELESKLAAFADRQTDAEREHSLKQVAGLIS